MTRRFLRRWDAVDFRFDPSQIHRPYLSFWNQEGPSCVVDEPGPMIAIISFGWGAPHTDAVWQFDVRLPFWLAERLPPHG